MVRARYGWRAKRGFHYPRKKTLEQRAKNILGDNVMDKIADDAAKVRQANPIPLGLHFGLPFQSYLEDPGLGSGDIRLLAKNPSTWWWKSRHNPLRPRKPNKKHFEYGRAVHKVIVEGFEAFDADFVRAPDHAQGMTSGKKSAATRAFNESVIGSNRTPLLAEDYDRVIDTVKTIKRNPYLAACFQDGHGEVSVFWEREGVRLKGRFDYLKVYKYKPLGCMLAANGDLKTVENIYDDPFKVACRKAVAEYDYDAQAAHYLNGLSLVPQMIEEGHFYGKPGNLPDRQWLDRFLEPDLRCAWQWIFIQKNNMPTTYSYTMTPGFNGMPGSPIFEEGASKVNVGLQRYIDCVERFGLDKPWDFSGLEPPEELVPEEMPRWYGSAR